MLTRNIFLAGIASLLLVHAHPCAGQTVSVAASMETQPVPSSGDAADDPAIWLHPTDPALSIIIGTDKQQGLAVYDMSGRQIQFLSDGRLNNVDIRYKFPLGGRLVDLVTAGNRSDDSIAAYAVDPVTRMLVPVAAGTLKVGLIVYGSCMYRSTVTNEFYFIVNSAQGDVEQWRLFDNGSGHVSAALVRSFAVGSQTEGCVADDEYGFLYIGEEDVGIWKYGAEPNKGSNRTQVDSTGAGGNLTADVEGLAIYHTGDGYGYLMASSQGSSEYVIYERTASNAYVGTFAIVSGSTIDGTSDTDGIDVIGHSLGSAFPSGVFVAQDVANSGGNQNYKVVPWQVIAQAFGPELKIDTTWNPREAVSRTQTVRPNPPTNLTVQ